MLFRSLLGMLILGGSVVLAILCGGLERDAAGRSAGIAAKRMERAFA